MVVIGQKLCPVPKDKQARVPQMGSALLKGLKMLIRPSMVLMSTAETLGGWDGREVARQAPGTELEDKVWKPGETFPQRGERHRSKCSYNCVEMQRLSNPARSLQGKQKCHSIRTYLSKGWREAFVFEGLQRCHPVSDTSQVWGLEGVRREGLVRSCSCEETGLTPATRTEPVASLENE